MSFILENERSQPATETDTVNRICSPTFKLGNTLFPPNDTMNFRMPRGVTSTPVCTSADKNSTVLYFIHKTSTVDVVWECCRKICAFPQQVIKVTVTSHESFSVQQLGNRTFCADIRVVETECPSQQRLYREQTSSLASSLPVL